METRYRILGPDEVIQEGDDKFISHSWVKCIHSIGEKARSYWIIRRPIPPVDPLVAELVDALKPLADVPVEAFGWEKSPNKPIHGWSEHAIKVADVLKARELLAKARAHLKTYETVDGKAIHQK